MSGFAWVTLATNDSYSLGALVLAHSLRQVGTAHQLAVLVTPGVTNVMRKNLADVFNIVEEVNLFDSKDAANLRLLKRPELGVTFTKLHCWRLTQFEKCVFLDADVLVLVNSDELFERDEFSAAPDVGWPDCFNSGVFVYRPSMETYNKLVDFALQKGSFDGGDQGLLNAYFSDWAHKDISKHLPFIYNMCSTAAYSYLPAFKYYGANAKIVHFIGPAKPWLQYFDTETRQVHASPDLQHLQDVLQKWWDIFCSVIHPKLSPDMSGLAGAFAQFTLGAKRSPTQDALENHLRRQAWEVGNIDYLGRDSFDNIWSKICQTLTSTQLEAASIKDGAFSSDTQQTPEVAKEIKSDVQDVEKPQELTEAKEIIQESAEPESSDAPPSKADVPKEESNLVDAPTPPKTTAEEIVAELKAKESVEKPDEDALKGEVPAVQETVQKEEVKSEETVEKPAEVPISDDKPTEEAPVVEETAALKEEIIAELSAETARLKEEIVAELSAEPAVPKEEIVVELSAETAGPTEKSVLESSAHTEIPKPDDKVEDIKSAAAVEVPKVEAQPEIITAKSEEKLEEIQSESVVATPESSQVEVKQSETVAPKDEIKLEDVKTEAVAVTERKQEVEDTVSVSPVLAEEKPILSQEIVTQKEEVVPPTIPETPKEEIKQTPSPKEPVVKKVQTSEVKSKKVTETAEAKPKKPAETSEVKPKKAVETSEAKPKKAAEAPKAETKPEPPKESLKTESVAPEETAQTETPAEATAPIPKSDIKPKETKKIKKKVVKKVVKADPAAESSEGSSKK